jgi:hypothetical protein
MDQPHQYGYEVLPLGRREYVSKFLQVVAKSRILDDNGLGHVLLLILVCWYHQLSGEHGLLLFDLLKMQNYCTENTEHTEKT